MLVRYGSTDALNTAEIEVLDDLTVRRGAFGSAPNQILSAIRTRIAALEMTGEPDDIRHYLMAREVFRELHVRGGFFAERTG
jgi:hypothetical protein